MKENRFEMNRRRFLGYFSTAGLAATLLPGALAAVAQDAEKVTSGMLEQAEKIAGLSFTPEERDEMLEGLGRFQKGYDAVRELHIPNSVAPALVFNPLPPRWKASGLSNQRSQYRDVKTKRPDNIEEAAFYSVAQLGHLLKSRKVTSTELTKMYLARLKKYDPELLCVVSLTEERALKLAAQADKEIASGNYRGPLHGVPWGAKDLLAVKGYKTTWGATPFKEQVIDEDAAVVQKLDAAGAVLVAKLTLGALAQGDKWFGGMTRNPWKKDQGSSGSSAGPGSATAAGLVGFAIGTETQGSIVSPSRRCGVSGLRPTFGRVSRTGAMALSWSMDKIGPMCRTMEDCALVFEAIHGADGLDMSVQDQPFYWNPKMDVSKLRVGYLKSIMESEPENDYQKLNAQSYKKTIEVLQSLGVSPIPVELPKFSSRNLRPILTVESAAAFDELTLAKNDNEINTWGGTFRTNRFVPAVEYVQANRARSLLIQEMDKMFNKIDLYVGSNLGLTNLTGHPEVVFTNGFREDGTPYGTNFTGKLYGEPELLALAHQYQEATGLHLKHPEL